MINSIEFLLSKTKFALLTCGVALAVSGCAIPRMPDGVKQLPSGPDGLQRFEVSKASSNEPPIATVYKNATWKIEMGIPEGWKVDVELAKNGKSPFKAEFTRPNGWLDVYCWDGITDVAKIRELTIAAIQGIDAPLDHGKYLWVIPGAGQPAEIVTVYGYHDATIPVPGLKDPKTGKPVAYDKRFNKTFKIIAKLATKPGGCNYGIQLLELAPDEQTFGDTLAGHALAIARGLK